MARAGKHPGSQVVTPLRQARLAIPATLEAVCADLDKSAPDGSSGITDNGWLWGRGSSDSKVAVAIFSHLAVRLAAVSDQLYGRLVLLFDRSTWTSTPVVSAVRSSTSRATVRRATWPG